MEEICFVIAPIGEEGSDTRKRSDQVLKHIIKPSAKECGYNAIRADEISEPGLITSQVIQHIIDDPLVIADLTDRNPNVFYELALRHALRKPLVQIIRKGDQIPFDVAGMRTILVDHHDLDSVEEAKKEIISQIKAVDKKPPEQIETPISVSIELQLLRQSDNPEERTLADLLSAVSDLRSGIDAIQSRLSNPESILPPGYMRHISRDLSRYSASMSEKVLMEMEYLIHKFTDFDGIDKKNPDYEKLVSRLDILRHRLRNDFMHERFRESGFRESEE